MEWQQHRKEPLFFASFNQRLLAQMIDVTLMSPVFYLSDYLPTPAPIVRYLALFVIYHLFIAIFQSSKLTTSPGKALLRLEILQADGKRSSISKLLIRELLKWLSLLLLFTGFFMIYFDPGRRALHDMITKTQVVSRINPKANW